MKISITGKVRVAQLLSQDIEIQECWRQIRIHITLRNIIDLNNLPQLRRRPLEGYRTRSEKKEFSKSHDHVI